MRIINIGELTVREIGLHRLISISSKHSGCIKADKRKAAQLARALAHFAERGELPEEGWEGDRPSLSRLLGRLDGHEIRIDHIEEWAESWLGRLDKAEAQITELKEHIAGTDWHVNQQLSDVQERLDKLEGISDKTIKALTVLKGRILVALGVNDV